MSEGEQARITYKQLKKAVKQMQKCCVKGNIPMIFYGPHGEAHQITGKNARELQRQYDKVWEDKA